MALSVGQSFNSKSELELRISQKINISFIPKGKLSYCFINNFLNVLIDKTNL